MLSRKFWELESDHYDVEKTFLTEEEQLCERLFAETTHREESRRYIVSLPFRTSDPKCKYGDSKQIAQKRFLILEKRFLRDPDMKKEYIKAINEYLDLGHEEKVETKEKADAVYLPHHAVVRNDKLTTKLRVVFDASCPGTICVVADIIKMYRQVKVSKRDGDFQRILWRENPEDQLQHFRLLRMTFGTSSAPYLRTILQRWFTNSTELLNHKQEDHLRATEEHLELIKQVSIPRLELYALAWLRSHSSRWKTFIANRVSDILTVLDEDQWCHVSTKQNPADCASRGANPSVRPEVKIWKQGPAFLKHINIDYKREVMDTTMEERKLKCHTTTSNKTESSILNKYSTSTRLTRVVAYCMFLSPNFGRLWKAGVKSTKHHLRRIVGNSTLTFEEMTTLLAQIEACLNSRPISQLPTYPDDPYPLTPGHFLIGEPLVVVPDRNYEDSNVSSLKRWHLTQRMLQDFWRRWSQEYLTQLQHRYKWTDQVSEPKVGDVVLIREDDLPPAKWLFGVIDKKHTGLDNLTRVVSVRCKDSVIKRPLSKLVILPVT
ncbi:PREDICTED: uncharacterized protein LOC106109715 [Papilio polytes]|uniref:uncharacterized protein LOC106109715 n=1 Tax=Papilio polytes TaxID=76194 RepID=UPI000676036F|nr:PREDICTED: uncharacterized protein LOC106109715 [Papilio polytes]